MNIFDVIFECGWRVIITLLLVYMATYLGDAYRELWSTGTTGPILLGSLGFVVLVGLPIVMLLSYIELVVPVPTINDPHRNLTLVWIILASIHGVFSTPFSSFGLLPWTWLSWWSLLHGVGALLFIVFLIGLPSQVAYARELDRRNHPWRYPS